MKDCGEKIIFPQFDTIIFTFEYQFSGNFSEKGKIKSKILTMKEIHWKILSLT